MSVFDEDIPFTDDNCKNWDVRIISAVKLVQFCRIDGKALVMGNDCSNCRLPAKREQTKLI